MEDFERKINSGKCPLCNTPPDDPAKILCKTVNGVTGIIGGGILIETDDPYKISCDSCDFQLSVEVMIQYYPGLIRILKAARPQPPPWPGYTVEMFGAIMSGTDTPEMWAEHKIRCDTFETKGA